LNPPTLPYLSLFPYTTLFRSVDSGVVLTAKRERAVRVVQHLEPLFGWRPAELPQDLPGRTVDLVDGIQVPERQDHRVADRFGRRSEEHTSELQSRENLVCRLL